MAKEILTGKLCDHCIEQIAPGRAVRFHNGRGQPLGTTHEKCADDYESLASSLGEKTTREYIEVK